jgi:hypothetical protein
MGLAVLLIPLMYKFVYYIYEIRYYFGMPPVIVIISMIFFSIKEMKYISVAKKSLFIITLLMGVQWLDLVPLLSSYGFGNGEISRDIKNIASIISGPRLLTFISWFLFGFFSINSIMLYKIFADQNKAFIDMEANREIRKELDEARLNSIKSRAMEETQNLVHDLKTPITTIQVYASLIEMMSENEKVKGHVHKITCAVDQLDHMISEILQENKKRATTVEDLFNSIFSQLSAYDIVDVIKVEISCLNHEIYVNKIRMSRAILNIIKNSMDSMDKEKPTIEVTVQNEDHHLIITILDNGKGIKAEIIERIWERGFSTKESFGIGLEFVKAVIENHGGTIEMSSVEGLQTEVVIKLPYKMEGTDDEDEKDINH